MIAMEDHVTGGDDCADSGQAAVIVACGGTGNRFKGELGNPKQAGVPQLPEKQFVLLAGKPVLAHTLDVLEKHNGVRFVVLVLPDHLMDQGEALVQGQWQGVHGEICSEPHTRYTKVKAILVGGKDRQASVANGLTALAALGWQGPVLVQDGVRPCTPSRVYDQVIEGVHRYGNAVAAIPIRDTIKRADGDGIVRETIDRRDLWQIQTPQGFWMADLQEAYDKGCQQGLQVTDDAALMEALGKCVHLVEGDPVNMKLTYPGDLDVLEAVLYAQARKLAVSRV